MTLDRTIASLGSLANGLPREAMQWALDHWDEAAPRFVETLDGYVAGADRSPAAANVVFFGLHLLGQRGDTAAFSGLCALLRDAEASETLLGDAISETLRGILIGTFDGDWARLRAVIEHEAADQFVRETCLLVMAYLARTGRIAEAEMRDCLGRLLLSRPPYDDDVLFCGCVMTAALLGYDDMAPQIEALFSKAPDPDKAPFFAIMELRHFHEALAEALADPQGVAGFEKEQVVPLTDAIAALSVWHFPADENDNDVAAGGGDEAEWPAPTEPYINPFRHVGRNDPCPCGSGRKFKKCCLNAAI